MTSPTQEAGPNAAGKMPGARLLTGSLVAAILLYVGLVVSFFVPFLGMSVFINAFFAFYLCVYIGLSVSAGVFVITLLVSRRVFQNRKQCLRFATQLAAIALAIAGIAPMAMVPLLGGQRVQIAGYSLHTRLWLDADRVRVWANRLGPSEAAEAAPHRWPLSLMMMSLPTGRVDVDAVGNVAVFYGSALSGHCGVYITARGQSWAGERWADTSKYDRIKRIEDGVWIWSSMN